MSELAAVGLPAVFVPYHVGNGEQALNAASSVQAGASIMVANRDFTPEWVDRELLALMADQKRLEAMAQAMASLGVRDAAEKVADMARSVATHSEGTR